MKRSTGRPSLEEGEGAVSGLRSVPQTKRARDTVALILRTAREIIRDEGGVALTTDRISEVANVSIGTVYNYFPNVALIVRSLYLEKVDLALEVFDRFDQIYNDYPDLVSLMSDLLNVGFELETSSFSEPFMTDLAATRPEILAEERRYADRVADYGPKWFRHFGSQWSDEDLRRLMLQAYYTQQAGLKYFAHLGEIDLTFNERRSAAVLTIVESCLH